ncbi:MAG: DUF1080 domain-containing protein [Bacteroidales bacterium]|nr:DUF1080 domain-containing protein [Bacteroidales bacterium]
MKNYFLIVLAAILIILMGSSCQREQEWNALFNGQDLSNWDMFLGSSLGPDFDSLAQAATIDKVFSVVEMDGENVIRISGEINGSLATPESFENYHLRLVFKWGETVYSRRNSGLLYHSFGDFGAAFGTWMPNIEFQMMIGNLGDTYLMLNTACDTEVVRNEETGQFVYTPGAESLSFGEHANGRMIRKGSDQENPLGEWNTIDLYTFGRTAVHVVNGQTVMVNTNTGINENGAINPLVSGKIQIQSEGAELFIKSMDIKPISKLPDGILP